MPSRKGVAIGRPHSAVARTVVVRIAGVLLPAGRTEAELRMGFSSLDGRC